MKLRNKKTGEIIIPTDYTFASYDDGIKYGHHIYYSLAELNEEWEDYEEPKEYYYLGSNGRIYCIENDGDDFDKDAAIIGNYFKTKEEAEKAVEKLKALKRLKDKGFKFEAYKPYGVGITFTIAHMDELAEDNEKDLDLLFGGE